jgi:hypothetical protein
MKDRLGLFAESLLDYLDGLGNIDVSSLQFAIKHAMFMVKQQDKQEIKGGNTPCQF